MMLLPFLLSKGLGFRRAILGTFTRCPGFVYRRREGPPARMGPSRLALFSGYGYGRRRGAEREPGRSPFLGHRSSFREPERARLEPGAWIGPGRRLLDLLACLEHHLLRAALCRARSAM